MSDGFLDSQDVLRSIIDYFKEKNFSEDVLPKIHISGCPNSCGVHQIGEIGFCGKRKDVFEIYLYGKLGYGNTVLASSYGDIHRESIPKFLYEIATILQSSNEQFYSWVEKNKMKFENILERYTM
jgi:Sulfite reductase, beta subunit (hemoprotein)